MKKTIDNIVKTFKAVGPILGNAVKSGQILNPQAELTEPDRDILCEYDVRVPMSEGFSLTANVFRSKSAADRDEKTPIVMCAHPYNNHLTPALNNTPLGGPPKQYRLIPQPEEKPAFSKLTSWESPDPNFWVNAGYAVVNLNLPGYSNSEGPPTAFSEHQGKCYYEAIEWFAKQPWCTGKIGLNGVSFLAITQYHVAACQAYGGPPPSLYCISPWEGITDPYRDIFAFGGLRDVGFPNFWWATEVKSTINGTEADFAKAEGSIPTEYLDNHPFYDDFWKAKAAKLEEITVPMLVCASFSDHCLHTMGSFRAFEKARSEHKWVYTHRTGKWVSYYSDEVQNLTREFMDCFLKDDTSSGFLDRPPVRLEVRSSRDKIHAVRHENEWPLARTQYTRLYLDAHAERLSVENSKQAKEAMHPAKRGRTLFNYEFTEGTELSGYMKLRVWVEVRSERAGEVCPDDMALYIGVNKRDTNGQIVEFNGSVGNMNDMVTRGYCRVSRRELDLVESTEWHPVQIGSSEHKMQEGEIVPVDIELYPSSTYFHAGEALQLIISSDEIVPSVPYRKDGSFNCGNHVMHYGDNFDSYLLIPEVVGEVE